MIASETATSPLKIRLLGPMQVRIHNRPIPHLKSRKILWLLALLVLRRDRPVERRWLAGTLWPDIEESRALSNLRGCLTQLRSALGEQGKRVQSPSRHTLILNLEGAEVDIDLFAAAMASKHPAALQQAVAVYRGPLLEDCSEDWAWQERNILEQDCLQALQMLADNALAAGDYLTAIGYYRRSIGLDPWGEVARRRLMEALAASGDRNAALQVYREYREALRSDPHATPDPETCALYERLRMEARRQADLKATPPATGAGGNPEIPAKVSGYLPHPLTDLIGREDERLEVAARLRGSRLVTLVGPGGIGKTRLALEVAAEGIEDTAWYPDGVWLVALEALSEERLVVTQIASALGVREESGRSLLERLVEHLRPKRLLVVLDNCEHLLEASAQVVARLLRECAHVRILATSREALGMMGETVWSVPALAAPDPKHLPQGHATLLRVLSGYESVQLFVERAQEIQKTFVLTANNAWAVAQICAQLQGIPLAIELAAARVKALAVEQLAARLDDHLSLLTGGNRTALPRQQTLRATLDWSNRLLSGREQLLLQRLSVFAGGWSLEAAEAVCSGDGVEPWHVLDLLTSLVEKSLVVFLEREEGNGARYQMLEMVRQYAAESLQSQGDTETGKSRHRAYFLKLVEEARDHIDGPEDALWMARLDTELDNLRFTLEWQDAERCPVDSDLRLTGGLFSYWAVRGTYQEGLHYLKQALDRDTQYPRIRPRAVALTGAGILAFHQGDYAAARLLYEEALHIWRELGPKHALASTLGNLGNVVFFQGDYATALQLFTESMGQHQESGKRIGIACSLDALGAIRVKLGDYDSANVHFRESHTIYSELGDQLGLANSFGNLGSIAADQDDHVTAQTYFTECLALYRELGAKSGIAWTLNSLGSVAAAQQEYSRAQTLHEESLKLYREVGEKQGIALALCFLGRVALSQGDHALAQKLHQESLRLCSPMEYWEGVEENLLGLAAVLLALSQPAWAARLWGVSHALRERMGIPLALDGRAQYDQKVDLARSVLGEEAFTAHWEQGFTLSWEQALEFALAVEEAGKSNMRC
ncbi:MAG: hypothetical protein JWN14_3593 [Chthonomonadales bacterium]|nr:hypothetical protein [Chthonomonadales bacterium]